MSYGRLTKVTKFATQNSSKWFVLAVILGTISISSGIALMATSGYLISDAALKPPVLSLTVAIVGVRAFSLFRAVATYLEKLIGHDFALSLVPNLRKRLYLYLEQHAPAGLVEFTSGQLLAKFVTAIDDLPSLLLVFLIPAFSVGIAILIAFGIMAQISLQAAIALLCCAAAWLVIYVTWVRRRIWDSGANFAKHDSLVEPKASEFVHLSPELHQLDDCPEPLLGFLNTVEHAFKLQLKGLKTQYTAIAITRLMSLALVALLLLADTTKTFSVTSGVWYASIVLVILTSLSPIEEIIDGEYISSTKAATYTTFDQIIANTTIETGDIGYGTLTKPACLDIKVYRVSAKYPTSSRCVLREVTFEVGQGRHIAITGPSGSGKTTLVNVLMRYLKPTSGNVFLGSTPLEDIQEKTFYDMVAFLPQNPHVFSGTLKDNLLLANPLATAEMMVDTLESLGLRPWLSTLPNGLNCFVGEAGLKISGGQRQLICLARVLLKDAPIVLLDEPTTHLDIATSRNVISTVLNFAKARTVIVISHEITTLDQFDGIIVMQDGEIVESGSFEDLMGRNGVLAALYESTKTAGSIPV